MGNRGAKHEKDLFKIGDNEPCPLCGAQLVIKSSRTGPFLGCANYPTCHHTQPLKPQSKTTIIKTLPERTCELCHHSLVLRQGRYGMFISCEDYPNCHYILSINHQPHDPSDSNTADSGDAAVQCPHCKKGDLVMRQSRFGKHFWGCSAYPSCKYLVNLKPIAKVCPKCQTPILLEKSSAKGLLYLCANKKCDYQAESAQSDEPATHS